MKSKVVCFSFHGRRVYWFVDGSQTGDLITGCGGGHILCQKEDLVRRLALRGFLPFHHLGTLYTFCAVVTGC